MVLVLSTDFACEAASSFESAFTVVVIAEMGSAGTVDPGLAAECTASCLGSVAVLATAVPWLLGPVVAGHRHNLDLTLSHDGTFKSQCPEGAFSHCRKRVPLGHCIEVPSGTKAISPFLVPK